MSMNVDSLLKLKKIYTDFNIDRFQLTSTSILFTIACASNFKWLKFTDTILPLKQYFHDNFINMADFSLEIIHSTVFSLLDITILLWFVLFFLILVCEQVCHHEVAFFRAIKRTVGQFNVFVINVIWLAWFVFKSIFFQNFTVPYDFADINEHWLDTFLSTDSYLFYFLSLVTILNYILAPIHYRMHKERKKELEFERLLKKK